MNDRDQRRYDRLTRVQTFGRAHAADFDPGAKALTHFTNIEGIILDVAKAKAGQSPARVSKETLLDALTLDFQNIARTARAIELTANGFAAPYRAPDSFTERAITTHADSLLQRLEDQSGDSTATKEGKTALRARFITYELPDDFVADLRADRQAIAEANQHNQDQNQGGVENTELIGALLGRASDEVTELDAIMHNRFARQPEKLRAWQSASRVERGPQREKKPAANVINVEPAAPQPKAA